MRKIEKLICVGRALKPYGKEGGIKLGLDSEVWELVLPEVEFLFLSIFGSNVPHRVKSIREGNPPIVYLKDIDNPEQARKMNGAKVYYLQSDAEKAGRYRPGDPLKYLDDYQLIEHATGRNIGKITALNDAGGQLLATVYREDINSEIFVPIHPDLVVNMDEDEKKITMDLPEGLLDL